MPLWMWVLLIVACWLWTCAGVILGREYAAHKLADKLNAAALKTLNRKIRDLELHVMRGENVSAVRLAAWINGYIQALDDSNTLPAPLRAEFYNRVMDIMAK